MPARRDDRRERGSDDGFTLVELLIVIVVLGVLSTVTVFAVRGITDQGRASATSSDQRILSTAQEAYMAQNGRYGTEAELVTAGLLKAQSGAHDITLAGDSLSYTITAVTGGGGGGGPTASGTAITWGGVPAVSFGTGPSWVIIGGATALAEWNALVTMIFVNIADITTTARAEAVHDASIPFSRVFSSVNDVPNFSGTQSLSLFMEMSNGPMPQTYAKIHDGSGRNVAWGFAN
jgi:prepilin-type N-terminal cleavage/methylation domain-containing protein